MPNQRVSPEMRETFVFAGTFHLTDAHEGVVIGWYVISPVVKLASATAIVSDQNKGQGRSCNEPI